MIVKSLMISMTLLCVTGCGMFTKETEKTQKPDCCEFFKPIYFSVEDDSPETIDQVVDYLIILNAVCGGQ